MRKRVIGLLSFFLVLVVLVSCSKPKQTLAAPVLVLEGNTVTWEAVEHATGYITYLNEEEQSLQTETIFVFDLTTVEETSFYVVATAEGYHNSVASNKIIFKNEATKLASPSLTLTGKEVSWNAVANASGYEVFVNGVSTGVISGSSYTIPSSSSAGSTTVYVVARGNGTTTKDSDASNTVTYTTYNLTAPVITLEENKISWEAVDNASGYEVYVNGDLHYELTATEYNLDFEEAGVYEVSVKAKGTGVYLDSVVSNTVSYSSTAQLSKATISLTGNVVSWEAVAHATGYKVYVDGALITTTTELNYTLTVTEVGKYNIKVVAVGDEVYLDSEDSNEVNYIITGTLTAPTISLTGNVVSWEAVAHATGYKVYVDGALITTTTELNYTLTVTEVGKYNIKVVAVGDEVYLDSEDSNEVNYIITGTLTAPTISLTGNVVSWEAVAHATGYKVYVDGALITTTTELNYTLTVTEVGKYNIKVVAVGDEVYLDSEDSNEVNYIITGTLTTPSISLENNIISWEAVAHATGYKVYTDGNLYQTTTELTIDLPSLSVGTHTVYVVAVGDEVYSDSEMSNSLKITIRGQLDAVTISLDDKTILWEAVENAVEYEVIINGKVKATVQQLNYVFNETAPGKYILQVVARGPEGYVNSEVSNSVTYTVTATVEAPVIEIDNVIITWEAVTHATGYKVYVDGELITTTTELSYTLTVTEVGKYSIKVVAVGDGEVYLDSQDSNVVEYLKQGVLTTPTITLENTTISWEAVENATGYEIYINGVLRTTTTNLAFVLSDTEVGKYVVKVVAIGSELYHNSEDSNEVSYIVKGQLATPVLNVNENIISWEAVENATGYEIYDGVTLITKVTELSYDLSELTTGVHNITVKAIGDEVYNDASEEVAVTIYHTLLTPVITITNNVVSWPAVEHASSYEVYINTNLVGNQAELSFDLNTYEKGQYTITVKAVGEGYYISSTAETTHVVLHKTTYNFNDFDITKAQVNTSDKNKLLAEYQLYENVILSIGGVVENRNFDGFKTCYNTQGSFSLATGVAQRGIKFTTDGPANIIVSFADNGNAGRYLCLYDESGNVVSYGTVPTKDGAKTVSTDCLTVSAAGTYYLASSNGLRIYQFAIEETLKELTAPVISKEANVVSWGAVEGAIGYAVIMQNGLVTTIVQTTELSYEYTATTGRTNIYVMALANSEEHVGNSCISNRLEHIETAQLTAPTLSASGNKISWSKVSNAVGYQVYVNDVLVVERQVELSYEIELIPEGGNYKVEVVALGDGTVYLDGEKSLAIDVVVNPQLATPALSANEGVLTWDSNENAIGYIVTVNGEVNEAQIENTFALPTEVGEYEFKVVSLGKEGYRDSEVATFIYKVAGQLSAPVIVQTSTQIIWDEVIGATGYVVYINDIAQEMTQNMYMDLPTTPGTYIYKVVAKGDNTNFYDSEASNVISYVLLPTLSTPVISLEGTILSWEAVPSATSYRVTIGNQPYDVTDTTLDLSTLSLAAGEYDIQIQAIGNVETHNNSELSNIVNFQVQGVLADVVLTASSNLLSWEAVENATGYQVYLNGEAIGEPIVDTTYNVTMPGDYYVIAIGDEIFANSNESNTAVVVGTEIVDYGKVLFPKQNEFTDQTTENVTFVSATTGTYKKITFTDNENNTYAGGLKTSSALSVVFEISQETKVSFLIYNHNTSDKKIELNMTNKTTSEIILLSQSIPKSACHLFEIVLSAGSYELTRKASEGTLPYISFTSNATVEAAVGEAVCDGVVMTLAEAIEAAKSSAQRVKLLMNIVLQEALSDEDLALIDQGLYSIEIQ